MRRSNKYSQTFFYCITILLAFSMTGCFVAGSRGNVRFNELKYPASMSAYLYGPNNELLAKDRELQVVEQFSYKVNFWGTLYSLVSLTGVKDVSKEINNKIEYSGADGIINMKVISKPGILTHFHPLTLIPFWPSYTEVLIEGEIVKYNPTMIKNASFFATPAIPGNVHILEVLDQADTIRLGERCRPIGKVETMTFRTGKKIVGRLNSLTGLQRSDLVELGILDGIKMRARKEDANVVQVLFLDSFYNLYYMDRDKPVTKPLIIMGDFNDLVVDVRSWSCPFENSQVN